MQLYSFYQNGFSGDGGFKRQTVFAVFRFLVEIDGGVPGKDKQRFLFPLNDGQIGRGGNNRESRQNDQPAQQE